MFRQGDDIQVRLVARTEIPSGLVQRGIIQDTGALGKIVGDFLDDNFGRRRSVVAAVAIPESLIFSKACHLPANIEGDLVLKAIMSEVRDFMPIALDQCHVTALPLGGNVGGGSDYLFSAVEKEVVRVYRETFEAARVEVAFFDGEAMALTRALTRQTSGAAILADIGARTSLLALIDGGVHLTSNIMVGGDMLTATVEQRLGVTLAEAEMIKQKAGFDASAADGRVMLILQKPMVEIIEEIRRAISFYKKKSGRDVGEMVVAGGTSLLPAMVEYMKSNFPDMEIRRGEPFAGLPMMDFPDRPLVERTSVLYATATGLALRLVGAITEPGLDIAHDERPKSFLSLIFNKILGNLTPQTMGKTTKKKVAAAPQGGKERVTTENAGVPQAPAGRGTADAKRVKPAPVAPAPVPKPHDEAMIEGLAALSAVETAVAPEPAPVVLPPELQNPTPVAPAMPAPPAPEPVLAALAPAPEPVEEDLRLPPTVPHEIPAFVPGEAEAAPAPEAASPMALPTVMESEEKDYGLGIGDILADADNVVPPAPAEETDALDRQPGVHRLKIEEILGRSQPEEAVPPVVPAFPIERPRHQRSRRRFPWLAVVLLLAFAVTAFLVFSAVRRYGLPFMGNGAAPEEETVPAPADVAPGQPASLSLTVLLAVSDGQTVGNRETVITRVIETDVESSGVFTATGKVPATGTATSAVAATGTIVIVNRSDKPLTLIEKTRFQTADGQVFRMKKRVTAAVGETPVEVYADAPGAAGNIAPTTFTVPGLQGNAVLYGQVTGRSDEAMRGGSDPRAGEETVTAVDPADVVEAKRELADKLMEEAAKNFGAMIAVGEGVVSDLVSATDLAVKAPDAGTVGGDFKMTLSQRYRALLLPEAKIAELLSARLAAEPPEGVDPSAWTVGKPAYTVEAYDTKTNRAEVRVEAPLIRK